MNLSIPFPHSASKPLSAVTRLLAFKPRVFLRDKGVPLMGMTPSERRAGTPAEAAELLMKRSFDSLHALKATGDPSHFLQLQGMVLAMMCIQSQGAVHIEPAAISKAWDGLAAMQARHYDALACTWHSPIRMTAPEMANLESAIHHYGAQLVHLNKGEATDAIRQSTRLNSQQAQAMAAMVRNS